MIGFNHYLTSERFLDHRLPRYPGLSRAGRPRYLCRPRGGAGEPGARAGLAPRLREAWDRYGIPIAITEIHHGCTATSSCAGSPRSGDRERLAHEGVDVRARDAWSLFGIDWRCLLTASPTAIMTSAPSTSAPARRGRPCLPRRP